MIDIELWMEEKRLFIIFINKISGSKAVIASFKKHNFVLNNFTDALKILLLLYHHQHY